MLTNLAIWYLNKRRVSVIMNYKIEGGKLIQKTNEGYTYGVDFQDSEVYLINGKKFNVPEGKFKIIQNN